LLFKQKWQTEIQIPSDWKTRYIFVRHYSDSPHKYSEVDIKGILGFLVDNIYVVFGDQVFQQSVGIPMGTNCAPLLADLLLYSHEAEFVQKLLRDNNKKLAVSFNHTYRYIDDHMSYREIKDTTESDKSASYLDIYLIWTPMAD
jgi:hypothetical protein